MECYSIIKKNDIMNFACRPRKGYTEWGQRQKYKRYILSHQRTPVSSPQIRVYNMEEPQKQHKYKGTTGQGGGKGIWEGNIRREVIWSRKQNNGEECPSGEARGKSMQKKEYEIIPDRQIPRESYYFLFLFWNLKKISMHGYFVCTTCLRCLRKP